MLVELTSAEGPLEWRVITEALGRRAATAMGRRLVVDLAPLADRAAVDRSLALIEELRDLRREGELPHLGGIEEIDELLTRADKDGVLLPLELISVGHTLEALADVARALRDCRERAPITFSIAGPIKDYRPLARAIASTFDPSGHILDDASADLPELRRRANRLRDEIKVRLTNIMKAWGHKGLLQEVYYTLRNERHVVPVRSDRRGEAEGIVHDTSNSGQTLFIEPQPVVDQGNRLKIAEAAVSDEETRVLMRLTQRLVEHSADVRADLERAAELDSFVARARLADELEAEVPHIEKAPTVELRGARHPTLVLAARERPSGAAKAQGVVANDICLEGSSRVLVISGPNAGGKTVALKTVGICALMLRAGLPIPAHASSRLSLFANMYGVIGDEQSIDQNLSSFSAHVLAIDATTRQVLEQRQLRGNRATLCLIDEIGQGTDAEQGACLGQAFLERLADLGALVVATTHFERLKTLALDDERFRNASLALDPDTLRPTFQLHHGVAGASSAFAIAAALGVQAEVVARARDLAGDQANQLEAHIESLAAEQERLSQSRAALEAERAQAEAERSRFEEAQSRVQKREKELRHEARETLLGDVRKARNEVAEIIAALQGRQRPTLKRADQAAHRLKEIEAKVEQRVERGRKPEQTLAQVQTGERVRVKHLNQDGEVLEVHRDGTCLILCGSLRTRVKLDELVAAQSSRGQQRRDQRRSEATKKARAQPMPQVAANPGARTPRTSHNTLDLRGQRVDEALANIERFFDRMMLDNVGRVFLLHGHGTGTLKKVLRKQLPGNAYVNSLGPAEEDEGGDAFTVVELEI